MVPAGLTSRTTLSPLSAIRTGGWRHGQSGGQSQAGLGGFFTIAGVAEVASARKVLDDPGLVDYTDLVVPGIGNVEHATANGDPGRSAERRVQGRLPLPSGVRRRHRPCPQP